MMDDSVQSPFGSKASYVKSIEISTLKAMYLAKCGYDPSRHFANLHTIDLYECEQTGMRFWRPARVAGDEVFYANISELWPDYYRHTRWEYDKARRLISQRFVRKFLEVGCGRGYFLKSIENTVAYCAGLEMNVEAIAQKVAKSRIFPMMLDEHLKTNTGSYDCVASFQVLEHVTDPMAFLADSARLLRSGGFLLVSTPNYDFPLHAAAHDAFDLPPHHLNHFTPRVFENIAGILGLKVVSIEVQQTIKPRFQVWVHSEQTAIQRSIRAGINALGERLGTRTSLGHGVLAVFRLP